MHSGKYIFSQVKPSAQTPVICRIMAFQFDAHIIRYKLPANPFMAETVAASNQSKARIEYLKLTATLQSALFQVRLSIRLVPLYELLVAATNRRD